MSKSLSWLLSSFFFLVACHPENPDYRYHVVCYHHGGIVIEEIFEMVSVYERQVRLYRQNDISKREDFLIVGADCKITTMPPGLPNLERS